MLSTKLRKRPTIEELQRAEQVLHLCGLRFDGYGYADEKVGRGGDGANWLCNLSEHFTHTLLVPAVLEDAFATLFCFQRGARDYGWFLDRSPAQLAGPLLFLHLYREPTPERWRDERYAAEWERIASEEREQAASIVRRWVNWGTGTLKATIAGNQMMTGNAPVRTL